MISLGILLVLFITVITDLVVMRIFSSILRKNYLLRKNSNNQGIAQVSDKKSLYSHIKDYLSAFCTMTLQLTGYIPSFRFRTFIYKNIFLMKIGKDTKIRGGIEFISPWNIEIGENCMIGRDCKLDGRNGIKIGNNVNISDHVSIWTEQHDVNSCDFCCSGGSVCVKDRVWLCFRSIVLPNITINEGVVLASGAIATKDCEEFSLYAGVPAKKIKDRNKNINYELDIKAMHIY